MAKTFDEHLAKGISLLEAGDYKKGCASFKKCTELEPLNPEGFFNLGDALAAEEKPEEAIDAYLQGLKLAPEDTEAMTALGDIYFELGRHKDALKTYHRVVELAPRDADGYVNIGLVYNSMERTNE
ncbi:MAG TPA: tetratricopeptide repeat protein, partial [Geobacteraceae bacterium]